MVHAEALLLRDMDKYIHVILLFIQPCNFSQYQSFTYTSHVLCAADCSTLHCRSWSSQIIAKAKYSPPPSALFRH